MTSNTRTNKKDRNYHAQKQNKPHKKGRPLQTTTHKKGRRSKHKTKQNKEAKPHNFILYLLLKWHKKIQKQGASL